MTLGPVEPRFLPVLPREEGFLGLTPSGVVCRRLPCRCVAARASWESRLRLGSSRELCSLRPALTFSVVAPTSVSSRRRCWSMALVLSWPSFRACTLERRSSRFCRAPSVSVLLSSSLRAVWAWFVATRSRFSCTCFTCEWAFLTLLLRSLTTPLVFSWSSWSFSAARFRSSRFCFVALMAPVLSATRCSRMPTLVSVSASLSVTPLTFWLVSRILSRSS
mmetsp:Transcript_10868/g.33977  ORF Transcript_10868/g.33977 Transcript_10868/m.33977 type:complete len:220 (+) Transcript_10868:115-774(+)